MDWNGAQLLGQDQLAAQLALQQELADRSAVPVGMARLQWFALLGAAHVGRQHPMFDRCSADVVAGTIQQLLNAMPINANNWRAAMGMVDGGFQPKLELGAAEAEMLESRWILTFTGRRFFPLAPLVSDICIEDIAHALSLQCRFAGHTAEFYSVAQHSVLVALQTPSADRLAALLHDAAEAYLVDVPRPLKSTPGWSGYRLAEENLSRAIAEKFGIRLPLPETVSKADKVLLATEARDLFRALPQMWKYSAKNGYQVLPTRIQPCEPKQAERQFLDLFTAVTGQPTTTPDCVEQELAIERFTGTLSFGTAEDGAAEDPLYLIMRDRQPMKLAVSDDQRGILMPLLKAQVDVALTGRVIEATAATRATLQVMSITALRGKEVRS